MCIKKKEEKGREIKLKKRDKAPLLIWGFFKSGDIDRKVEPLCLNKDLLIMGNLSHLISKAEAGGSS